MSKFEGYIFAKHGPDPGNHYDFFSAIINNNNLDIPTDEPRGIMSGVDGMSGVDVDFSDKLVQFTVATIFGKKRSVNVDLNKSKFRVVNDQTYGQILLMEIYSE